MGAAWVGGILFGATVPDLFFLLRLPGAQFTELLRILTGPVLGFLCYFWASRLDQKPVRLGIGIAGLASCLAVSHGVGFVSAMSGLEASIETLPLHGLLALRFFGSLWLSVVYLGSLRLLFRYSQARVEFPESITSLWSPAEKRETRRLLHAARWWPVVIGFGLAVALVIWTAWMFASIWVR